MQSRGFSNHLLDNGPTSQAASQTQPDWQLNDRDTDTAGIMCGVRTEPWAPDGFPIKKHLMDVNQTERRYTFRPKMNIFIWPSDIVFDYSSYLKILCKL